MAHRLLRWPTGWLAGSAPAGRVAAGSTGSPGPTAAAVNNCERAAKTRSDGRTAGVQQRPEVPRVGRGPKGCRGPKGRVRGPKGQENKVTSRHGALCAVMTCFKIYHITLFTHRASSC